MAQVHQVGEFPPPRPAITRTPKNPIDKSTIVSIYPKAIIERKYTIEPGLFEIPAGRFENPSILVVGTSSWWSYSGDTRPTIEVPVSSVVVAESVVKDFSNGMLACDMVDARPGLFFVPGELNILELKVRYKNALEEANVRQRAWFMNLVKIGDSLWARANGNPLCISEEMRIAARELSLNDKPWIKDFHTIELKPCFACGSLKNPLFPVCQVCRAIDPAHTLAKDIKFAGV